MSSRKSGGDIDSEYDEDYQSQMEARPATQAGLWTLSGWGSGLGVQGLKVTWFGLRFKAFRVWGRGLRVQGLGFRVARPL